MLKWQQSGTFGFLHGLSSESPVLWHAAENFVQPPADAGEGQRPGENPENLHEGIWALGDLIQLLLKKQSPNKKGGGKSRKRVEDFERA